MMSPKFPADLVYAVRESIREQGFCVFGSEELDRLLAKESGNEKRQTLENFAAFSGVKMETTPNLNSARFISPPAHTGVRPALRSPVCSDSTLTLTELEPELFAYRCPRSGGVWIPLNSYLAWLEGPKAVRKAGSAESAEPKNDARRGALVCPESGHVMLRYRVGHGISFHIDVSPEGGGIWLDAGKWEALKSRQLHLQLNLISTPSYQRKLREEEHAQTMAQSFRERIGDHDFEKVVEFKEWLVRHPKRASIVSYLVHDLPPEDG